MTRAILSCLSCALVLSAALAWMRRAKGSTESVLFVAAQRVLVALFYARALAAIVGMCLLATQVAWRIGGAR